MDETTRNLKKDLLENRKKMIQSNREYKIREGVR